MAFCHEILKHGIKRAAQSAEPRALKMFVPMFIMVGTEYASEELVKQSCKKSDCF